MACRTPGAPGTRSHARPGIRKLGPEERDRHQEREGKAERQPEPLRTLRWGRQGAPIQQRGPEVGPGARRVTHGGPSGSRGQLREHVLCPHPPSTYAKREPRSWQALRDGATSPPQGREGTGQRPGWAAAARCGPEHGKCSHTARGTSLASVRPRAQGPGDSRAGLLGAGGRPAGQRAANALRGSCCPGTKHSAAPIRQKMR